MVTLSSQQLFRSKGEELLMGEKVSGKASFHITQPTKWERESGDGGQREEAERRYHSALPPSAQHYANASKGGMETVRHLPNKENCVMGNNFDGKYRHFVRCNRDNIFSCIGKCHSLQTTKLA